MPDTLFKQNGSKITNTNLSDKEGIDLFDTLKKSFSWIKQEDYRAIAPSYYHEVLGEQVTRTCVTIKTAENLVNKKVASAHRLFGLESKTSMLYITLLFDEEKPSWATDDMFILGKTEHFEEYGRPCNPEMLNFKEYFFVASEETLLSMGVDISDINNDTVYSVLVKNNEIKAVRRYTNFVENDDGILANWQLLYVLFAKRARRIDLIKDLFSKPFIKQQ